MTRKPAAPPLPRPVWTSLRQHVRPYVARLRSIHRDRVLRRDLRRIPRRIVIGASGVCEPGWIATDADQLNLLKQESWDAYFAPMSIDAMVAEHVWEHLTLAEARIAASICYRYLAPGGYIRIAVPDGLFPDPEYRDYIRIGGPAGGGDIGGHKFVYTYLELREVFESAGFETDLLEYHDETSVFHGREWDPADGMIHRSKRFDPRGPVSIILDAKKQLKNSR